MIEPTAAIGEQVTPSKAWEQWEGYGYDSAKTNPVIYYYPGKIDIENDAVREELVVEIHRDGIAPTKGFSRLILEDAVVVHGQVEERLGELWVYTGDPNIGFARESHDATWVEIDEYED